MKCCLNQHGFKENQIITVSFNNQNADYFFFISDRNLVFLFHNEGFCPGAVGCAVSLQGTYMSGEPAGSKSLAGGADACKGLEKGGL